VLEAFLSGKYANLQEVILKPEPGDHNLYINPRSLLEEFHMHRRNLSCPPRDILGGMVLCKDISNLLIIAYVGGRRSGFLGWYG